MRNLYLIGAFFLLTIFASILCCKRIEAGHVGIKVNQFGNEKGVSTVTEVTGTTLYFPPTQDVISFPTYVQSVLFARPKEGDNGDNHEIRINTADGLVVSMDVSINYRVSAPRVPYIYVKYRKDLETLNYTVLYQYLNDAFGKAANDYSAEKVYLYKNRFISQAVKAFKDTMAKDGFIIERVSVINEIRLPESILENIKAKVNATQIALKKQDEVAQVEADAKKKIAEARGDSADVVIRQQGNSRALLIDANAKAEANALLQKTYTPMLVQIRWIEAWEKGGSHVPAYLGGSQGNMMFQVPFK